MKLKGPQPDTKSRIVFFTGGVCFCVVLLVDGKTKGFERISAKGLNCVCFLKKKTFFFLFFCFFFFVFYSLTCFFFCFLFFVFSFLFSADPKSITDGKDDGLCWKTTSSHISSKSLFVCVFSVCFFLCCFLFFFCPHETQRKEKKKKKNY